MINDYIQFSISMKRIERFLLLPEIDGSIDGYLHGEEKGRSGDEDCLNPSLSPALSEQKIGVEEVDDSRDDAPVQVISATFAWPQLIPKENIDKELPNCFQRWSSWCSPTSHLFKASSSCLDCCTIDRVGFNKRGAATRSRMCCNVFGDRFWTRLGLRVGSNAGTRTDLYVPLVDPEEAEGGRDERSSGLHTRGLSNGAIGSAGVDAPSSNRILMNGHSHDSDFMEAGKRIRVGSIDLLEWDLESGDDERRMRLGRRVTDGGGGGGRGDREYQDGVRENGSPDTDGGIRVVLKDVSLSFPVGKLTVITGPTGCGKSTLISGILEECVLLEGSVVKHQEKGIAYVSQTAWIQNATVRDNILFGRPFSAER